MAKLHAGTLLVFWLAVDFYSVQASPVPAPRSWVDSPLEHNSVQMGPTHPNSESVQLDSVGMLLHDKVISVQIAHSILASQA